ncbi:MFS transporter [bacterium]|nr:MFS transporter [bacterium]
MKEKGPVYRDSNMQMIFMITMVAIMGVSSITPALPLVMRQFGLTESRVGLLITCFTLPGVLFTPILGVWADRYGRKTVLVPALLLFGLAGSACALVNNFHLLLALRFVQGLGAASLGSLNVTLIGDLFSGERRTAAVGLNAGVLSVGAASYPAVGGLLATFGWHFPFLLPLLALPIGLTVLLRLEAPHPGADEHLWGYLAGIWRSVMNPQALALFASSTLTFIMFYGPCLTFMPLLLDASFGARPALIGAIMSSMSLTNAAVAASMPRLVRHFSRRSLIASAYILFAAAMLLVRFAPHSVWFFFLPTMLLGVGMGLNGPQMVELLTGIAPLKHRGGFMSINGLVLRLGQTLGPLLMGGVYALWGMHAVFWAGSLIAASMLLLVGPMTRSGAAGKA